MGNLVGHVTDTDFAVQVLGADKLVLVDFWAEWCGPCRSIAPLLDELALEMGDQVKIVKLNVDENPNTPQQYFVRGIPALMLFKNGEVVGTQVGAVGKPKLVAFIQAKL